MVGRTFPQCFHSPPIVDSAYFPPLLVRLPIPVAGAFGFCGFSCLGFFSLDAAPAPDPLGRPLGFFSPFVTGLSFFAPPTAPFGRPLAFLLTVFPPPSASSSALRFSPFFALLGASSSTSSPSLHLSFFFALLGASPPVASSSPVFALLGTSPFVAFSSSSYSSSSSSSPSSPSPSSLPPDFFSST